MTFLMWFIGLPVGILAWCYALATLVNMFDDFGDDAIAIYTRLKAYWHRTIETDESHLT